MRKLLVCAFVLLALIVAYNIHARTGSPQVRLELFLPSLGGDGLPSRSLANVLMPGVYALWYLGMDADTTAKLIAATLMSWWAWLTVARLTWYVVGRAFGFASLREFHWWLALALPWRAPYRVWMKLMGWWGQLRYGSRATAAWTGVLATMTMIFKPGDCVFLGRLWIAGVGLYQAIGLKGSKHVVVVGGSGGGKTRWVKAWLGMLHKKASALVFDTDGEIVNALGRALARAGHRIINLDPFRLSTFPGARWNPLTEIDRAVKRHGRQAAVRFALTLAEALIQEDNSNQPIFATTARTFVHGLLLYCWLIEPEERRNLVRVRELLTRGLPEHVIDPKQDPFDVLLSFMMQAPALKNDGCEGQITAVIARAASVMKSGKTRDGNPFRTTAMSQTTWIDIPEVAATLLRSDFACEDLKTGNLCVFLCAPVTDIQHKLAGWARALTMMAGYAFQNIPGRLKIPSLWIIDEMPSLGHIQMLETAAPVFRRFGVRLVVMIQDIERLQQVYPKSWESFLGNAMCVIWLMTAHWKNLEHLYKMLGNYTHTEIIEGANWLMRLLGLSKIPPRYQKIDRPLLHPEQAHEFLDIERHQVIVTVAGKRPLRIAYEGYDRALRVSDYDADANYREPILRAFTRRILCWLFPARYQRVDSHHKATPTK